MTDYKVKHKSRKRIKSARWLIFWVVAAQLAAEVAMQAAVSFMSNPPHEYIQIGIVELFALGVPILLYGKSVWSREDGDAKKELRLRGGKLSLRRGHGIFAVGAKSRRLTQKIDAAHDADDQDHRQQHGHYSAFHRFVITLFYTFFGRDAAGFYFS